MEEYSEIAMGAFTQIKKGNLFIGVDFGFGKDFSTEITIRKEEDGSVKIISSNIIGRAEDFNTTGKREEYLKKYRP